MSESRPRAALERRRWDAKRFVKMAQSVARKGAPVLRIAYPIWLFSVILTPMPPLPVVPYERTSLDQPGWSRSCQLLRSKRAFPQGSSHLGEPQVLLLKNSTVTGF